MSPGAAKKATRRRIAELGPQCAGGFDREVSWILPGACRCPVQHLVKEGISFGAVNPVRAVETGDAALFGNSQFVVKLRHSRQFSVDEASRLDLDAIPGTDLDHEGAGRYKRRQ